MCPLSALIQPPLAVRSELAQLLGKAGLADAGLSLDEEQTPVAADGTFESCPTLGQLGIATDEDVQSVPIQFWLVFRSSAP